MLGCSSLHRAPAGVVKFAFASAAWRCPSQFVILLGVVCFLSGPWHLALRTFLQGGVAARSRTHVHHRCVLQCSLAWGDTLRGDIRHSGPPHKTRWSLRLQDRSMWILGGTCAWRSVELDDRTGLHHRISAQPSLAPHARTSWKHPLQIY